ncbi:MAG TPA: energy transducer TonB [Caulobacteraceae bacterium]|jgi:TonB family protein
MRICGVVLFVGALGLAGGAAASPSNPTPTRPDMSLPLEGTITNPDWVRRPTGDEVANYYPHVAELVGLNGHVTMECAVNAQGATENCTVLSEKPVGLEFGKAALAMSGLFRMKPMTLDGAPVAGAHVIIPIGFLSPQYIDQGGAPPSSTASEAPPSPRALQLARQLVEHGTASDRAATYVEQARQSIENQLGGQSLTEQEQAAIDAFVSAITASVPAFEEIWAIAYARRFTEAQLTELDAFFQSTTGQAWIQRGSLQDDDSRAMTAKVWESARDTGEQAFCKAYDCGAQVPHPAPSAPAP